ncbi:MFS transporter [Vibrio sp. ES.051]|uniref:MFS transporter n=1 Tax=Vibrio sp. ES.051 TaxID=1761909 RepID=UPI000BF988C3|nr:MFS transporter [Vibrio sp. ES.051]PFG55693.1 MFS transporter [Vibrio sp. ES.051]
MDKDKQNSIYEKIINDEDARACKAIPESACHQVPGNFLKIIYAQFLTKLGDALINPKVTLPWILQSLGAPVYLVGWLVPIRESGSLIPQLSIAYYIRLLPVRKWVWVLGCVLQALSIFALALVTLTMTGVAAGYAVIVCLVVFSFSRGLNSVASKDVLGKTIPKNQRGQVNGWSSSAAGLVTLVFASLLAVTWLWGVEPTVRFYSISLALAGIIWLVAAWVYARINEYAGEVDGGKNGGLEAFKQLVLLKTDVTFRRFVITRTLFLCSALSAPYYIVLAQQSLGGQLWVLALFMFSSGLASFVSGPFWGRMSDYSSRSVMVIGATISALLGIALFVYDTWITSSPAFLFVIPLLYFCVCIAHDGIRVGRKTYLIDIAEGDKRTSYVAVSNTVVGVMLLLMSSLGAMANVLSLSSIVLVFSFITLIGVLLAKQLPDIND